MSTLADTILTINSIKEAIADEIFGHKQRVAHLEAQLAIAKNEALMHKNGLDVEKIKLGKTIIAASNPANGGADWKSCVNDAITQLAENNGFAAPFQGLAKHQLCTKNYDRWRGQRSDHSYSGGPKHGSICFYIGMQKDVRGRTPLVLTPEEQSAAIYYLMNLESTFDTGKTS